MTTDYDLLNFITGPQRKPGTDLMPKCMLEKKKVMNIVVTSIVGDHAKDQYVQQGGEWLDGKRVDILYVPVKPSSAMPPVIVEVQNTVDNSFIRRLQQYCSHVYHQHGNIDPVANLAKISHGVINH